MEKMGNSWKYEVVCVVKERQVQIVFSCFIELFVRRAVEKSIDIKFSQGT